ncbi:MAG: hypothetical protein ABIY51_03965 [Ferruginibacter sp.]
MSNFVKILLLSIISLVMVFVMNESGKPLKTPITPLGIINLEVAANINRVTEVQHTWKDAYLIKTAITNTCYDFAFLVCYASLFYFCCRQVAKQFSIYSIKGKLSTLFSYSAILAGIMDLFENTGMLLSLNGHISNAVTMFTFTASLIKWILVAGCIIWLMSSGIILLYRLLLGKYKIDSAFAK